MASVFVFSGDKNSFPSAVFSTEGAAKDWISRHCLTGTLTQYPLDVSAYDWAIGRGYFEPKRDNQRSGHFIANFSSAHLPHVHFEEGKAS